ncbi:MAG TPA: replicative DNA helicase [Gammaproteobacteria bacterium]|nr:replicative DNA helicase [Gammaproteobacteria bacterium]
MAGAVKNVEQVVAELTSVATPPHSVEAEQAVLGGLLLDNAAWEQIADRVREEDFYRRDHRLIFRGIGALLESDRPCDVVTLAEWLDSQQLLAEAGGLPYLAALARDTPSAANVRAYADIVRERSVLRQLIRVGGEIATSAYHSEGRDTKALLDDAERKVFEIAEQTARSHQGFTNVRKILSDVVERIDALFHSNSPITGLPTGLARFDELTAGLQPGDLIVIAGRPSMGKTSFAMNIAENVALEVQKPVAIFSMEMSSAQLVTRLISSYGAIDQSKLRTGRLDEHDWPKVTRAIEKLSQAPLYIDDTPALTPTEVRARARRLKREQKELGLIVIDYLQLMQVAGTTENRATEVSEISRSLKALAKELNVPVIALSQLNRNLEQRTDKRPVMSDLRESGSIEQDADLIAFIYRDEVYNPDTNEKGIAEIIIGKQRNGPIGTVKAVFQGQFTRFVNLANEDYYG